MRTLRYRYEDSIEEEGVLLVLREFLEVKQTPCGAWVKETSPYSGETFGKKRFVLNGPGKRLCHQTKEMALASYQKRKSSQFTRAKLAMDLSGFMLKEIEKLDNAPGKELNLGKPSFWNFYLFD